MTLFLFTFEVGLIIVTLAIWLPTSGLKWPQLVLYAAPRTATEEEELQLGHVSDLGDLQKKVRPLLNQ